MLRLQGLKFRNFRPFRHTLMDSSSAAVRRRKQVAAAAAGSAAVSGVDGAVPAELQQLQRLTALEESYEQRA